MGSSRTKLADLCEIVLHAPSTKTPLIQQIHIMAAHAICELVELNTLSEKAIWLEV